MTILCWSGSPNLTEVSRWLDENHRYADPDLAAMVKEWSDHWFDQWSLEFSKRQLERVAIIGDWIEENGGNRKWATSLIVKT